MLFQNKKTEIKKLDLIILGIALLLCFNYGIHIEYIVEKWINLNHKLSVTITTRKDVNFTKSFRLLKAFR